MISDLLTKANIDPIELLRMRDRRDYEYTDYSLSAEEPEFVETASQDKRAPKGFMGMRGKKASNGFYGVRGKKDLYNTKLDNDVDNNHYEREILKRKPLFAAMGNNRDFSRLYNILDWNVEKYFAKRIPSGFMGMRGRRGVNGFYGVRGKREISDFNNFEENKKRSALTNYIGIRGKKLVSLMLYVIQYF